MAWSVGVARVGSAVLLGLTLGGYASGAGAGHAPGAVARLGTEAVARAGGASGNDAATGRAQANDWASPSNVASGDGAVAGGAQTHDWAPDVASGDGIAAGRTQTAGLASAGETTQDVLTAETTPEVLASAETDRMHSRDFDSRQRLSSSHPNELWRLYGTQAAGQGQWQDAARHFRRAARFADKYSQHRLSLLYWHGLGVAEDRALAYAWADLAAERGYPQFLLIREKMWGELDAAQRQRALAAGPAIFDEFADAVAKPRLKRAIAHARTQITGSRTGLIISPLVVMASRGGGGPLDAVDAVNLGPMYADWRMDSRRYWAVEDAIWQNGSVEVGPVQKADPGRTP